MLPPLQYAALGFETFADDVLMPLTVVAREPLAASMWQPSRPRGEFPHPDEARAAARGGRFRPVDLGHRWGPVWSTAWFRLTGRVPASMKGRRVSLRWSSGTESTLWEGGRPRQGFDPYRSETTLLARARGGEPIDLLVEAACNLPLGISTFWWDHPELHARWKERNPGRLEACELVVLDDEAWGFRERWSTARKTLLALPPDSPRAGAMLEGMKTIMGAIRPRHARADLRVAASRLDRLLRGEGAPTATTCVAVGHAHIDTAWLWTIAETRRKCMRTFANVLRLMERFPHFRFLCSQAQHYAWIEEDSPALFREIAARVREGRWETAGAMWIEPDCTCPSGESFIRQILHGTRYWTERFGPAATQRFLYLPDTFGFPACLPQIGRLAGLDTFITNKMSWCESNRFPHVTFRWRGLDGTEILSHLTPGHNYNSSLEPADLLAGERNVVTQDAHSFHGASVPLWLQPYGFGDGGGGPTAEQVHRSAVMAACEGLPRVDHGRVDRFCDDLHASARRADAPIAAWDGELYLELHRGTYTSQAWIKRQNRLAESMLRDVEALACSVPTLTAARRREVRDALDQAWKLVLLNQFHDILPGSSIAEVYDDARRQHANVSAVAMGERDRLERDLAAHVDVGGAARPVLVRNPASTPRGGVVECGGALLDVDAVPALGWTVVDRRARGAVRPRVTVAGSSRAGIVLANERIEATVDASGRLGLVGPRGSDRVANARGPDGRPMPMNQLVLYADLPRRWEAWDIDRDYAARATPITGNAEIEILTSHPLRAEVRVRRRLGAASELFQTYRLDAGSRRLEIRTEVDWREDRTLLRAHFPCDVRATHATFGTQFGSVQRTTHCNTSWDEARFEVPGHAWMDLSEPGFGVAILDDGKYGRSAHGSMLGLSLLRSPSFPDPGADRGEHVFTYALMLHEGDWRGAGVDAEAEALREPLRAMPIARRSRARADGGEGDCNAPFRIEAPPQCLLHVAAWKPAEGDSDARVLRVVETRGGRGRVRVRWPAGVRRVQMVDVRERPLPSASELAPRHVRHDARSAETTFDIRPFQIVTMQVTGA